MKRFGVGQRTSTGAGGRLMMLLAVVATTMLATFSTVAAATTTVTQNTTTWTQDDTRGNGSVTWTVAYDAPAGLGSSALQLTTDDSNADKAGLYTHTMEGTPLSDVTNLSYWTYQASAGFSGGDASFQLQVETGCGFTTLVYEPYENGTVVNGTWQSWDVSGGQFWSSRTVSCDGGATNALSAGAGGSPFYTLANVVALFPNAIVAGIGVNVGTYNPSYVVAVDGVQFNDTVYNFEIGTRPSTKDECKDGGWQTFNDPAFRNQGDCIQFVNTGK